MGSMFNTGYRNAIDGDLGGLPADVADQAREAPGLALEVAGTLGATAATRWPRPPATPSPAACGFSMVVGATLLLGAAAFVWLRGPSREQDELLEDVVDDDPADRLAAHPDVDPDLPLALALE